jgi:hypothetical protein
MSIDGSVRLPTARLSKARRPLPGSLAADWTGDLNLELQLRQPFAADLGGAVVDDGADRRIIVDPLEGARGV